MNYRYEMNIAQRVERIDCFPWFPLYHIKKIANYILELV